MKRLNERLLHARLMRLWSSLSLALCLMLKLEQVTNASSVSTMAPLVCGKVYLVIMPITRCAFDSGSQQLLLTVAVLSVDWT
jgi:hypothetical protein